ncbi:MAG: sigma-54 dependent transcriptional regulator [Candidatus Marinimicrobia bacterium]|nr:sigma-54 dependent transcriptional regulator [Candidatus Neomarinimicrobiota bacterium]
MLSVFVIDDDKSQREALEAFLKDIGCEARTFQNGQECIQAIQNTNVDVVITDYRMPGLSGIETLQKIKNINPMIQVIVVTAYGTIEKAVKAMKLGAWDYISKPIEMDELEIKLERIREHLTLVKENEMLKEKMELLEPDTEIIYRSREMEEIINLLGRISNRKSSVLIQGETGTGKELIARTIHDLSDRKDESFVAVNCAAIPENLFESELFGYEKGAFTGADSQRKGRFEIANNGTLFLDEVGEIPLNIQVKLLRVLQEKEFQRLGSSETHSTDVRIIAATNQDLKKLVDKGDFRADLYYRLNVIPIDVPPLQERKEDIPVLVDHFIEKHTEGDGVKGISSEALDLLLKYEFPGNIRELENIIERTVSLARGDKITSDLLFLDSEKDTKSRDLNTKVANYEKSLIKKALSDNDNNQTRAARDLGVSVTTLNYKVKKYFGEES